MKSTGLKQRVKDKDQEIIPPLNSHKQQGISNPIEKFPAILGILTAIMIHMAFVQLIFNGLYYP